MKCELCVKPLRRARRTSLLDYLRSIIGIYPWLCTHCEKKSYHVRLEQFALVATIATLCLAVPVAGLLWYKGRHQPPPPRVALEGPKISVLLPGESKPEQGTTPQPEGAVVYLSNVLHNEDIGKMSEAKIGGDVLIGLIRSSAHSFHIDPPSLIALKKQGTPDSVIREIIEVTPAQGGVSRPASQSVELGEAVEASYRSPNNGSFGLPQRSKVISFR